MGLAYKFYLLLNMTELLLKAVVDPNDPVGGISQSQLAANWWQVAFGLPEENNPLLDFTGDDAVQQKTLAQDGKLLYLFGTFDLDNDFVTTRNVTLPQGVENLFGPLVNVEADPDVIEQFYEIDADSISDEAIQQLVEDIADTGQNLFIKVNEAQVSNAGDFRQSEGPFVYTADPTNVFEVAEGEHDSAFAGGFYVGYDVSAMPSFEEGITIRYGGKFNFPEINFPEEGDPGFNLLEPVYEAIQDDEVFPQDLTYNLKFELNKITNDDNGDDVLRGTNQRDLILGSDGNDILIGGKNNDNLRGGNGSDTLNGTNPGSDHPGRGEIDILFGGNGRDKFVLGHGSKTYYLGEGHNDYAIIEDLQNKDRIKLGSDEFDLSDEFTLGGERGTSIFVDHDLVAFVKGVHPDEVSEALI